MPASFSASHRAGAGSPLVCLHGITDTWRTWELVLPALEDRHDVLAPTLAGHAGGPRMADDVSDASDKSTKRTIQFFSMMQDLLRGAAPRADAIAASSNGRRRATESITTNFEHIPAELIAHQIRGAAACDVTVALLEHARGWSVEVDKIACPVRIVWGTEDKVLPWPAAAERYRQEWFPGADWVKLDGVGHCPQLDVPEKTAGLILGFTSP